MGIIQKLRDVHRLGSKGANLIESLNDTTSFYKPMMSWEKQLNKIRSTYKNLGFLEKKFFNMGFANYR